MSSVGSEILLIHRPFIGFDIFEKLLVAQVLKLDLMVERKGAVRNFWIVGAMCQFAAALDIIRARLDGDEWFFFWIVWSHILTSFRNGFIQAACETLVILVHLDVFEELEIVEQMELNMFVGAIILSHALTIFDMTLSFFTA